MYPPAIPRRFRIGSNRLAANTNTRGLFTGARFDNRPFLSDAERIHSRLLWELKYHFSESLRQPVRFQRIGERPFGNLACLGCGRYGRQAPVA